MTDFLVKTFIKSPEDVTNLHVRSRYGTLSSVVGIICNILLFIIKYIVGTLANSISITSDAFNNLSDAASCIVTLLGYKLAAKPADKGHPFGHGRMEYLISLIIAAVILFMGLELLKNSFIKVIHPDEVKFSAAALGVLIVSIGIKLWLSLFNTKLGTRINSSVMLATAKDSRSDVLATAATAAALICSVVTDAPIDGITGIIVSAFVIKSGIDIIKDTVDELLGKPADPEIIKRIREIVCRDDRIMGLHDLMIHNYGPGNMIGSCHAEVKSTEDFVAAHDLIDRIEHEIHKELKIAMTIHMDPIETDNEQVNSCRRLLAGILEKISPNLGFHDFRMVIGDTHINLIFDLVVPFELDYTDKELKSLIDSALSLEPESYYTVITFDRDYT